MNNQITRLHDDSRLPGMLRKIIGMYITNGRMDKQVIERCGGCMYDGACFYPMRGNQVLYYHIIAKDACVLQIKMPCQLTKSDEAALSYLKHSECSEEAYSEFARKYNEGYYRRHTSEGFPQELLPYIPFGCYGTDSDLVVRTTPVAWEHPRERTSPYGFNDLNATRGRNYRFGQGKPSREDRIEADQINFGKEYARGRLIPPLPREELDEVASRAMKISD